MSKRLVICCDGTWNKLNQAEPTNVVKIKQTVAPYDARGWKQEVYYHPGVGTHRWELLRGGAFGFGLSQDVRDTYRFLVEKFETGDELFFFGFSRGAFTARSIVGLVRNCGILRRKHADKVGDAYRLYRSKRDPDTPDGDEAKKFRSLYSHETRIRFIGVWDTVGSLGIPLPKNTLVKPLVRWINRRWAFHDTELSSHVEAAFHALAIDEKRGPFEPTVWAPRDAPGQWREQVWFAGAHSDVGGGLAQHGLADITLLWIADRARDCGLTFGTNAFPTVAPNACGPLHQSRNGVWHLSHQYVRELGRKDPRCEYVASSAIERSEKLTMYRPVNLARCLEGPHNIKQVGYGCSDSN